MQKLLLALLLLIIPAVSVSADQKGFDLQETNGQYLDVSYQGQLVGRYLISPDSAQEKSGEIFKPYLDIYDAQGTAPITEGPHHPGIFIGYEKLRVNDKTYDLWHMTNGDQIHQSFSAMKATSNYARFTSVVDWNDSHGTAILAEDRTFTFLTPPAYAYAEVDMISKLTALVGDTQLDGLVKKAGIHFHPGKDIDPNQTVYVIPKKQADPLTDVDYPWVGESFTLKGKEYSVVYLNDPSNPGNTLFSAFRDYGRVGACFKATIARSQTLTLHVRFLISEGEMPSAELIQKAYNDFAGRSGPVPSTTILTGQPMKPPAATVPASTVPAPATTTTNPAPP